MEFSNVGYQVSQIVGHKDGSSQVQLASRDGSHPYLTFDVPKVDVPKIGDEYFVTLIKTTRP